jgi:hypothetical protein
MPGFVLQRGKQTRTLVGYSPLRKKEPPRVTIWVHGTKQATKRAARGQPE